VIELLRGDRPVVKVGHRGAPTAAGDNTLESLAAAVELSFDAVEIDVLRVPSGRLVLAHDLAHADGAPALDDALELLARHDIGILLDLKGAGHELALAEAARRHAVVERSFVSTASIASLRVLAAAEPALARSLTYPDDRFGLTGRRVVRPVVSPALVAMRRALPYRLPRLVRRAGACAVTLNWNVVTAAVVARCHALGIAVYAWTVDDPAVAAALLRFGTDGIITDDPRIFDGLLTT
jgi:glycerophosphoryl diester phosphodiesterase